MEKGEKGIQKKREEIISNYIYKQLIWNGKGGERNRKLHHIYSRRIDIERAKENFQRFPRIKMPIDSRPPGA